MDSGPTYPRPFAFYDHDTSSWRTWIDSLFEDSIASSPTWPQSGMTSAGVAYELRTSGHPIGGPAGSDTPHLLGTPRCADAVSHPLRKGVKNPRGRLEDQISLLPTPRTTDGTNSMTAPAAMAHVEAGNGSLPEVLGYHLMSGASTGRPSTVGNDSSDDRHPTLFSLPVGEDGS